MTAGRIRPLSARAASRCETAKTARCRCRCGGLLHGAGRFTTEDEARELRDDDAHHAGPPRAEAPTPEASLGVGLVPALDLTTAEAVARPESR